MAQQSEPAVQTFLFADLSGFTALTQTHGDEQAADLVGGFYVAVRRLLAAHQAHEVKPIGDGRPGQPVTGDGAVECAAEGGPASPPLDRLGACPRSARGKDDHDHARWDHRCGRAPCPTYRGRRPAGPGRDRGGAGSPVRGRLPDTDRRLPQAGLDILEQLAGRGDQVALLAADLHLPGMDGVEFPMAPSLATTLRQVTGAIGACLAGRSSRNAAQRTG